MKIRLLFFGILAEVAGSDTLEMEFSGDMDALRKKIEERFPEFGKYSYQVSLNKVLTRDNTGLKSGDEVAFLPPFAGG